MDTGRLIAGRYRLAERIGSGGNGEVYRAIDTRLERVIAVKRTFATHGIDEAERIRLLRREAKLLAKLNHPNVVTLYDIAADGHDLWLVMEYVPARSLADRGTIAPTHAAAIGEQIASALCRVHAAGIIHRDIKPGNVLMTEDGMVKLGDFGISRIIAPDSTLTDNGLVAGTPGYLAPEVANGAEPTAASDVFSLGATLFAAIEGESPFGTGQPLALINRAAAGRVATPQNAGPLAPALSALLRVDPAARPTALDARALLADAGTDPPLIRPARRFRAILMAAAAAVAVVAGLVSWILVERPDQPPQPAAEREPAGGTTPSSSTLRGAAQPITDPHTVDPCALTDPAALSRFGDAVRESADGNFNRCDIRVQSGASDVDVKVQLDAAGADQAPQGQVRTIGSFRVVREASDNQECDRDVLLPGEYMVNIAAAQDGRGPADLCGIADAATNGAVTVLSLGPLPARNPPPSPKSLINANACALPTADALAHFPGVDALHPTVGFGDWECRWFSTTSQANLLVVFDRNQPMTAADGRPIRLRGHDAFVESDGGGDNNACKVAMVHRRYVEDGEPTDELLVVEVTGPQSSAQRCRLATDLATAATGKLPPA